MSDAQLELEVYSLSCIGGRKKNEDALFTATADPESDVFIVCDGMGGAPGGGRASNIACQAITKHIQANGGATFDKTQLLRQAFASSRIELKAFGEKHPDYARMGTTAVVALFDRAKRRAILGHVGDSRIYWLRQGQELYRSSDHSSVMELVKLGIITASAALTHPKKHLLTRVLSAQASTPSEEELFAAEGIISGDIFLLCSDGVWECLPDAAPAVWAGAGGAKALRREIVSRCRASATDNYTYYIVVVR